MDRCHGKTKAGDRCRRSVPDGQTFCSAHADQESESGDSPIGPDDTGGLDTLLVLAAAGVILAVGLVLRRTFRLL